MGSDGYNPGGGFHCVRGYGDLSGHSHFKFAGTSAAAPHVAGLAALMIARDPTLTANQIQAIIQFSSEDQVGPSDGETPDTAESGCVTRSGSIDVFPANQRATLGYLQNIKRGKSA